jgi:hypothetical protein
MRKDINSPFESYEHGIDLKNVMSRYIDNVYNQYEEMTNFLLKEEEVEKEILTKEETNNE